MELEETIELMKSEDFRDRFRAEYFQLKIRINKLHKMLIKNQAGTLNFKPTCPINILEMQLNCMEQYLKQLEIRAEIEEIDLSI